MTMSTSRLQLEIMLTNIICGLRQSPICYKIRMFAQKPILACLYLTTVVCTAPDTGDIGLNAMNGTHADNNVGVCCAIFCEDEACTNSLGEAIDMNKNPGSLTEER